MEQASNKGWHYLGEGKCKQAERYYVKAVEAAREKGDKAAEALFLSYVAESKRGQGRATDARADLETCLEIAGAANCLPVVAHAHFMLSELDSDAADDAAAIAQLWRCLDTALECGEANTAEYAFGKLGRIYFQRGWMEPASECFRQALEHQPNSPNCAAWLGNLGQTLAEMGQIDESIDYYHKALDRARLDGDLKAQAKCFASEALSHFHAQRFGEAIKCFKQALALLDNEDPGSKGTWLGNLGNVYLKMGETERASDLVSEGLKLAKRSKDKRQEAAHLDSLGDCFLEKGDAKKALKHYADALKIGRSISDRLGERIYLANLGKAYQRLGKQESALEHLRQAVQIFDEQRSRINSDSLKTSFAAGGQDLYRDTIEVCLKLGKRIDALEYVGRAKSRAILDLLRNSPIDVAELEKIDDKSIAKLVARERELSQQIAQLERIYWQGPEDGESGHRGAAVSAHDASRLYSEWRQVLDQLRRRHKNYANMVAVETLDFKQIKELWRQHANTRSLSKDTAILEFFISDHFLFAAAVWADCKQPEIHILLESKELSLLNGDIADFLEMSATEGWEVPISLCKRLHQRLLAPLVASLPASVDRLILVPHGVLHRVPFAALHDGNQYLVQKFALSYLPTSSLVPVLSERGRETADSTPAKGKSKSAKSSGATKSSGVDSLSYLVSAISDYSATRHDGIVFSSRLRSAAGLEDLSYVLEEGKTVFGLAGGQGRNAKLLTNDEVKEGLLKMFSDYQVVHFAGHAVFNPEEPLASGLVLSDGSILTAARILQDNALRTNCGKLLVLSACQTGVNVITNGGEILGLARALIYAGMPNLILSLWEVADRSTSQLMSDFHEAWQAGKTSIARALAEAQVKAIASGQPIHAWAPFVHLGID
jgi:CHAT domain-containing protein/Tfp pilus assembly protein PilF